MFHVDADLPAKSERARNEAARMGQVETQVRQAGFHDQLGPAEISGGDTPAVWRPVEVPGKTEPNHGARHDPFAPNRRDDRARTRPAIRQIEDSQERILGMPVQGCVDTCDPQVDVAIADPGSGILGHLRLA